MNHKKLDPGVIQIPEIRITAAYDGEMLEMLKDSLKAMGQVQPLVVMQVGETYYLVDGLHRLQEAIARGDARVDVVITEGEEADVYLKNLVTNRLRGKTKASEMCRVLGLLGEEYRLDSDQIRERTGLSRDYIERLLVIYQAGGRVLEALDEELLGVTHAFLIARLPDEDIRDNLLAQQLTFRWTAKDLAEHIEKVMGIVSQREEAPPDAGPEAPPLVRCHFCGGGYPIAQVTSPPICIGCVSILHDVLRSAVAEAKKAAEN